MMTKQQVIEKLKLAHALLVDCNLEIDKMNNGEHQFDYVSDPRLADIVDSIIKIVKSIDKIVYQERK